MPKMSAPVSVVVPPAATARHRQGHAVVVGGECGDRVRHLVGQRHRAAGATRRAALVVGAGNQLRRAGRAAILIEQADAEYAVGAQRGHRADVDAGIAAAGGDASECGGGVADHLHRQRRRSLAGDVHISAAHRTPEIAAEELGAFARRIAAGAVDRGQPQGRVEHARRDDAQAIRSGVDQQMIDGLAGRGAGTAQGHARERHVDDVVGAGGPAIDEHQGHVGGEAGHAERHRAARAAARAGAVEAVGVGARGGLSHHHAAAAALAAGPGARGGAGRGIGRGPGERGRLSRGHARRRKRQADRGDRCGGVGDVHRDAACRAIAGKGIGVAASGGRRNQLRTR